jgi:hypothetical protein
MLIIVKSSSAGTGYGDALFKIMAPRGTKKYCRVKLKRHASQANPKDSKCRRHEIYQPSAKRWEWIKAKE